MNKKDLIRRISKKAGFTISKSAKIVQSFIGEISNTLQKGQEVSIRGFGSFKLYKQDKRRFYNISKKSVDVLPEKTIVKFAPSKLSTKKNIGDNIKRKSNQFIPKSNDNVNTSKIGTITSGVKNTGKRRNGNNTEFHDNNFEYLGIVNYDCFLGEFEHTQFPAVKIPQKGVQILKWYKSHKDAVVGVSEPLLLAKLKELCKNNEGLVLLEKIAIPIQSREYSYRPDAALYFKEHNICIDIERDEPYDICSHKPLHYIGSSDNLRDTYFTRNGWCVLRYSENQVLHHIDAVVKHIEFVIKWLVGSPTDSYTLKEDERWTYQEALDMATSLQREKNIGTSEEDAPKTTNEPEENREHVFIKPTEDILPKVNEHSHDLVIEKQLDYALDSNAQYIRITKLDGYQWILDKNTIQKGTEEGSILQREKNIGTSEEDAPKTTNEPEENREHVFIKPTEDILPKVNEHSHDLVIEKQLDYALDSNAQYIRITKLDGYQWILDKNTIQKGTEEGSIYITGDNIVCPSPSGYKYKYHLNSLSQITPIRSLFTDEHWRLEDKKTVNDILVKAATYGSPVWIKYRNSQGQNSERFITNIALFFNTISAKCPFTYLGLIADTRHNWVPYIFGYCSLREEFRQFASDSRLLEVRVVNCKYCFIYPNVYRNSFAELIMHPYGNLEYFKRVDYLLKIMPKKEKDDLLTKGNVANLEVLKGNIQKALNIYTSISFDEVMWENEGTKYLWGDVCISDIETFIKESQNLKDSTYNNDIVPSKVSKNFTEIKSLLIQAGWIWNKKE